MEIVGGGRALLVNPDVIVTPCNMIRLVLSWGMFCWPGARWCEGCCRLLSAKHRHKNDIFDEISSYLRCRGLDKLIVGVVWWILVLGRVEHGHSHDLNMVHKWEEQCRAAQAGGQVKAAPGHWPKKGSSAETHQRKAQLNLVQCAAALHAWSHT